MARARADVRTAAAAVAGVVEDAAVGEVEDAAVGSLNGFAWFAMCPIGGSSPAECPIGGLIGSTSKSLGLGVFDFFVSNGGNLSSALLMR